MEFFEHRDAAAALAAMNGRKILGKVKELTNIIMSFLLKSDENIWHFSIILYQLVPVFLMLVRNGKDIVASIISQSLPHSVCVPNPLFIYDCRFNKFFDNGTMFLKGVQ